MGKSGKNPQVVKVSRVRENRFVLMVMLLNGVKLFKNSVKYLCILVPCEKRKKKFYVRKIFFFFKMKGINYDCFENRSKVIIIT